MSKCVVSGVLCSRSQRLSSGTREVEGKQDGDSISRAEFINRFLVRLRILRCIGRIRGEINVKAVVDILDVLFEVLTDRWEFRAVRTHHRKVTDFSAASQVE